MPELASFGISLVGLIIAIIAFSFKGDVNKTVRFAVGSVGLLFATVFGALGLSA